MPLAMLLVQIFGPELAVFISGLIKQFNVTDVERLLETGKFIITSIRVAHEDWEASEIERYSSDAIRQLAINKGIGIDDSEIKKLIDASGLTKKE